MKFLVFEEKKEENRNMKWLKFIWTRLKALLDEQTKYNFLGKSNGYPFTRVREAVSQLARSKLKGIHYKKKQQQINLAVLYTNLLM